LYGHQDQRPSTLPPVRRQANPEKRLQVRRFFIVALMTLGCFPPPRARARRRCLWEDEATCASRPPRPPGGHQGKPYTRPSGDACFHSRPPLLTSLFSCDPSPARAPFKAGRGSRRSKSGRLSVTIWPLRHRHCLSPVCPPGANKRAALLFFPPFRHLLTSQVDHASPWARGQGSVVKTDRFCFSPSGPLIIALRGPGRIPDGRPPKSKGNSGPFFPPQLSPRPFLL